MAAEISIQRNRLRYLGLIALVIGTGLLWRSGLIPFPSNFAKYGGDSLWALMVFLGLGFIFARSSTMRVAAGAVCFAWSVEFSQLYHATWIDEIRATRLGHLVLGHSFNGPDLIAYLLGVAIGVIGERAYYRKSQAKHRR